MQKHHREIKIECTHCENSKIISFTNDDDNLYNYFKISKISRLNRVVFSLFCKQCNTKRPNIFLDDKLVFDQDNLKICSNCNLPISLQRLESLPGTNLCTASCVKKVDKKSKALPIPPTLPEKEKIGRCGHQMEIRYGKKGWFIGCSKYPSCRNTKELK